MVVCNTQDVNGTKSRSMQKASELLFHFNANTLRDEVTGRMMEVIASVFMLLVTPSVAIYMVHIYGAHTHQP